MAGYVYGINWYNRRIDMSGSLNVFKLKNTNK